MSKRAPETIADLNARRMQQRQKSGEVVPVCNMLVDSPGPQLLVPTPYILDETHTYRLKQDGYEENETRSIVAHSPILVTGVYQDIDTGRESLELCWRRHGVWRHQIIEREICADTRKIISLSANGFPVSSVNAKQTVDYIARFEALNLAQLPVSRTSGHLGWQGKNGGLGFLFGRTWIPATDTHEVAFRGMDSGDEQIADGYHSSGSIDEWINSLLPAMKFARARVAFYTAFVPSILHILKCSNFVLDFAGRTSVGKTTLQQIAASVVGNPDEKSSDSVLGTWDSTKVFIERASSVVTGMPVILDDTKRAKNGKTVADALYTIANGRGRGRGNTKGISRTETWRTVLISSGEQPATSFTNDGGAKGRTLEIRGLPFGSNNAKTRMMVERLKIDLMTNYGHGMPLFIRWVLKHEADWLEWTKQYRDSIVPYAAQSTDAVAGRLAAYAAAIETTAALVHVAFAEEGHELPWKFENPLSELWEGAINEASDPLGEEEAVRDVMSWAAANETSFYGRHVTDSENRPKQPTGGWFGRWDRGNKWTCIVFDHGKLRDILIRLGYNESDVLNAWREREWLDVTKGQKGFQKKVRICGEQAWGIVLRRAAVESVE